MFKRIWEEQSKEGYNYVPYVCTLLSTTLWAYYGYITGQDFIVITNGLGFCAQAIYVAIFIVYDLNP